MLGAMQIKSGSTDVTLQLKFFNSLTGALKTGVTITDLDIWYIRVEDDEDVTISAKADMLALGSLTDAHADNSGYEIGHGYYRIDLPDEVFAAGATTASIVIEDAASDTILPCTVDFQLTDFDPYNLKAEVNAEVDVALALIRKILKNKAIQTKSSGVIVFYDDDGVTPILTFTPTDGESTITRTPS